MYKYDLHVHTGDVSPCGKVEAARLVRMYKDVGYTGIVITDHFAEVYFNKYPGHSWDEKIDLFLKGYLAAKEAGEKNDLIVLPGFEFTFVDDPNDYLLFGLDEDFLRGIDNIHHKGLAWLKGQLKSDKTLIYQAHPFRDYMVRADNNLLDGIEVYNGHPRHESRNHLAYKHAETNGLKMISGSDFHREEDLGRGGVIIPEKITTIDRMVEKLKDGKDITLIQS